MISDKAWNKLSGYAISHTYRVLNSVRNSHAAQCKVCGLKLPKGNGFQVHIVQAMQRHLRPAYLCRDCFAPVKKAHESHPVVVPLPDWWSDLDTPIVTVRAPRVEPDMDKVKERIEQREKERREA